MNKKLLDILVCPVTKGPLIYDREANELISVAARLAYPVVDDIPALIEGDARALSEEEAERLRKAQPQR
ncbi:MAG: Trm112 family protein [Thiohalocapsa sp.]|uniref:Trm112 family protein n=1 Tax=Thiohalocapsa sp. TaxID=2497641 RepID=UPI0025F37289|nr:Trm112 family protein [Thiohalocapsa sp.]MCG6940723.1 Trm112 family protein [Thiohalocapsa sp.]